MYNVSINCNVIKYTGSQYETCNEYGEKNINLSHMIKLLVVRFHYSPDMEWLP